uniref:AP-3 complex subunit beta n=1 Tax=Ascaris suum TaxID=6253 RepID=F1KVB7_ASCSU
MSSFAEGLTSPEIEIAEGGAIVDSKTRFADLKAMLDSSKDSLKMDAMKRIINLVAKGRDVSELFAAVVKNVAAKNLELKKLVYVYLVRYAEEQQDLALLSISTFQRALKDPNQLIRASALRVLSSIRVPMIAPIMLLAIRESVRDMSAYVRKVAAHAIPKLYALEEGLQGELIECIDYLLGDKRTLVLGSAVYAFEETCPDRIDLLHTHYRSLCRALADVDEWGQVVMIGLLTRYARSQFVAPSVEVDPDLALLLSSCRPLLQSRNCAVVMAVAQLFYHCAPAAQVSVISKALVRLLRGPREVQSVVLVNIATICSTNPNMFEPFLKSFFIRASEPTHIKLLKLQVLTSLVSETNVQLVLRELQTYVGMGELADAAVDAIGQCALRVGTVADSCLSGLVALIASQNENVVSAAVVVLKRLLHSDAPLPLLTRVLRLIDSVKAPQARACVLWLIATHVDKVQTLAPDLLRIMAKNFAHENAMVKMQTMNLAVKLWLTNPSDCQLLVQYVMQLARFDQSYDVRDRCRLIRNLLFGGSNKLTAFANDIFMTQKPSPTLHNSYKEREQFQLGTLSHYLNQRCARYRDLPQFPEVAPDPSVRRSTSDSIGRFLQDTPANNENIAYSEEEEEEEEEEEAEEEEEGKEVESNGKGEPIKAQPASVSEKQSGNLDLLLDLNFDPVSTTSVYNTASGRYVETAYRTLLNESDWLLGIGMQMRFARSPSTLSSSMCSIELRITNSLETPSPSLQLIPKDVEGIRTSGALQLGVVGAKGELLERVSIDFGDSRRTSEWILNADKSDFKTITIDAPMGEQIEPISMDEQQFDGAIARLSGMNEHSAQVGTVIVPQRLYAIANCTAVNGSSNKFCAQTLSKKKLVLIVIDKNRVHVHCENLVLGSLLCDLIVKSFTEV